MMMPELWAVLALALLAVAAAVRILVLSDVAGPWAFVAMVARVVACLALVLASLLVSRGAGREAVGALRQAALGLALATLVVYVVLVWRLREDAVAPIVDLVVVVLVLTAGLAGRQGEPGPIRLQRGVLHPILWVLFLVGAGGVLVAGSTGLMLVLRATLRPRAPILLWPRWLDLHVLLKHATLLSLVALGGGLVVSVWWAWLVGSGAVSFGSSDDGLAWLAITWLIAAMSHLARRIGKTWGPWAAGLAISAAVTALVGWLVLVAPDKLL